MLAVVTDGRNVKSGAGPHDPGGFDRDAALTLGRAVAGSSAQMKGRALGIYEPSEEPPSKAARSAKNASSPMRYSVCASLAGQCPRSARRVASVLRSQ